MIAEQDREIDAGRSGRRLPDRVFAEDGADRRAEHGIGRSRTTLEGLRRQADEGNRGTECVADRGAAAGRVPAEQAFRRQAHPGDAVLSPDEGKRGRRNLDDVAAPLRIEQVGAAELVGEGLAVVAITDYAIDLLRRGIGHEADDLPAAAAYLHVPCHVPSPSGDAAGCSPGWPRLTSRRGPLATVMPEYFRQLMGSRALQADAWFPCPVAECTVWRTDHDV